MPAFVAGIHADHGADSMARGWLYIMTNTANGTLCAGVTSNLPRRIHEHREGLIDGFTKRYGLKQLVHSKNLPDDQSKPARQFTAAPTWKRRTSPRMTTVVAPATAVVS